MPIYKFTDRYTYRIVMNNYNPTMELTEQNTLNPNLNSEEEAEAPKVLSDEDSQRIETEKTELLNRVVV